MDTVVLSYHGEREGGPVATVVLFKQEPFGLARRGTGCRWLVDCESMG